VSGTVERVLIEPKGGGRRRLLRILSRRQEGLYVVLELTPQRRRCCRAGCLRFAEVPAVLCHEHERRGDR
jgi:hypothetical protein